MKDMRKAIKDMEEAIDELRVELEEERHVTLDIHDCADNVSAAFHVLEPILKSVYELHEGIEKLEENKE